MELSKYKYVLDLIKEQIKGSRFEGHVFAVGGSVRDMLMGNEIKDIDLVIDIEDGGIKFAEWITNQNKCFVPNSNPVIFRNYGTAKFNLRTYPKIADIEIECVQTRKEQYHNSNSRNPICAFGTIEEDANRRDLTINALYYDITNGRVIDPTQRGLNDIKGNVIRCPNKPDIIFSDDPLRMLRCIRFSTRLGWGIDKDTWIGICKNVHRIGIISQERITDEINKILLCNKPSVGIRKLYYSGLLKYVLPNVYDMVGLEQNAYHFGDVFEHTMSVLDNTKPILTNRLSGLFHDVGKKTARSVANGIVHFYGHEYSGYNMCTKILHDMKYPNDVISKVRNAVKNHMRFKQNKNVSKKAVRKFLGEIESDDIDLILDVIHADNISHKEEYNMYEQVDKIKEIIANIKENECQQLRPKLPINGNDIIEHFKLKKGPLIGRYIELCKEYSYISPKATKEDYLNIIQKEINRTI